MRHPLGLQAKPAFGVRLQAGCTVNRHRSTRRKKLNRFKFFRTSGEAGIGTLAACRQKPVRQLEMIFVCSALITLSISSVSAQQKSEDNQYHRPAYELDQILGKGREYQMPARVNLLHPSPHRRIISLDGEWDFEIDPQDAGISERWFDPDAQPELARRLTVPGSWESQGVGEPTAKTAHSYVGAGWYRRSVVVPADWSGARCWLKIGGAHRYADVWVNGVYLGHHETYVTAFKYEITDIVKPGAELIIAIRVDNRLAYPNDMTGCFSWFVNWGGLYRSVELEANAATCLRDVVLAPDAVSSQLRITADVDGPEPSSVVATVGEWQASADVVNGKAALTLAMPGAALWSPRQPHLHTVDLHLCNARGEVIDSWIERFGVRSFEVRNEDLYLNGAPVFLRGYGNDCVWPLTIHTPVERDVHRGHFSKARSYGFNYVRHHSWTPPPEYLDAADELGFLLQIELPVAYQRFLLPNVGKLEKQLREIVVQYRNHPSLAIYCMGNEFAARRDEVRGYLDGLVAETRQMDPTRFVRPTDPSPVYGPGNSVVPGNIFGFGGKGGILHEYGNVCVFPDVRLADKYVSGYRPTRLSETLKVAQRYGQEKLLTLFADNSARLQAVLTRIYLENALAQAPEVDGYNYWLITDCAHDATTGIFDDFWGDRGVWTPETFSRINAATTLLLKANRNVWKGVSNFRRNQPVDQRSGLGSAWPSTFNAGAEEELDVLLCDYSGTPWSNARLWWRVETTDGETILTGESEKTIQAECYRAVSVGRVKLKLPATSTACSAVLHIGLKMAQREVTNNYRVWIFPSSDNCLKSFSHTVEIKGANPLAEKIRRRYGLTGALRDDPTVRVVAGDPDADDMELAASGGTVLALADKAFSSEQAVFGTSWWQGGNNRGTVLREHPALDGFPHEGFADLQLQRLIDGGRVMILTNMPVAVNPIIRGIDAEMAISGTDQRLAGRPQAYLMELPVGERGGRLLVTTLNFSDAIDTPEGVWLFDRLLRCAVQNRPSSPAERADGVKVLSWLRPSLNRLTAQVSVESRLVASGKPRSDLPTVLPGESGLLILDLCYSGAMAAILNLDASLTPELNPSGASRQRVVLQPGVKTRLRWTVSAPQTGEWPMGSIKMQMGDSMKTLDLGRVKADYPASPWNSSFELSGEIVESASTLPVARYDFTADHGRKLHDTIGANHGRIEGAVLWLHAPDYDTDALTFDGRTTFAVVPDAPALDLTTGFAVEVVFRYAENDNQSAYGCLIDKGGSARRNYGIYLVKGGELSVSTQSGGEEFLKSTSTLALAPGVWHHAVWTCDGCKGQLVVNGAVRGSWDVTQGKELDANNLKLFLGKRGSNNDMFFQGDLASIVIARVEGMPTLAPLGWQLEQDASGSVWIDREMSSDGDHSLCLTAADGICRLISQYPVKIRSGSTYSIKADVAVSPDYPLHKGMPAVIFTAGADRQVLRLSEKAEAQKFVELGGTIIIPEGITELRIAIETAGSGAPVWIDNIRVRESE
jgi:beta-galactosidase